MADMNIHWGAINTPGRDGSVQPAQIAPGSPLNGETIASAETITNLTASTQSTQAPDHGDSVTCATICAVGGDLWLAFGANPSATVNGADCVFLPAGSCRAFGVVVGDRVAGINGA
ncbi:MAG: hypothetical protein AAF968_05495 [Pseudomonadota bacterium]